MLPFLLIYRRLTVGKSSKAWKLDRATSWGRTNTRASCWRSGSGPWKAGTRYEDPHSNQDPTSFDCWKKKNYKTSDIFWMSHTSLSSNVTFLKEVPVSLWAWGGASSSSLVDISSVVCHNTSCAGGDRGCFQYRLMSQRQEKLKCPSANFVTLKSFLFVFFLGPQICYKNI